MSNEYGDEHAAGPSMTVLVSRSVNRHSALVAPGADQDHAGAVSLPSVGPDMMTGAFVANAAPLARAIAATQPPVTTSARTANRTTVLGCRADVLVVPFMALRAVPCPPNRMAGRTPGSWRVGRIVAGLDGPIATAWMARMTGQDLLP